MSVTERKSGQCGAGKAHFWKSLRAIKEAMTTIYACGVF